MAQLIQQKEQFCDQFIRIHSLPLLLSGRAQARSGRYRYLTTSQGICATLCTLLQLLCIFLNVQVEKIC